MKAVSVLLYQTNPCGLFNHHGVGVFKYMHVISSMQIVNYLRESVDENITVTEVE